VYFDRFGMLLVLVLIVLFQNQFFRLIEWALMGLAQVFLTNYIFL
jgi:hypothetical protein